MMVMLYVVCMVVMMHVVSNISLPLLLRFVVFTYNDCVGVHE